MSKRTTTMCILPVLAGSVVSAGTFTPAPDVFFSIPSTPFRVTTGDFNGDGVVDFATTSNESSSSNQRLNVSLGTGGGLFSHTSVVVGSGLGYSWLRATDLDGDGNDDLLVSGTNFDAVRIFMSNGDGTFTQSLLVPIIGGLDGLTTGDFNGDGELDIISLGFSPSELQVSLGEGDGTFVNMPSVVLPDPGSRTARVGDFNGDGNDDLFFQFLSGTPSDARVVLGNGDGTFQAPIVVADVNLGHVVRVADLDNDGALDLVGVRLGFLGSGLFATAMGNGDGTFQPQTAHIPQISGIVGSMSVADYNGDGNLDVAVGGGNNTSVTSAVAFGNGDGTFTEVDQSLIFSSTNEMVSEDMDGDGDLDLIASTTSLRDTMVRFNNTVNPYCAGDCDGSGTVDFADLVATLFAFGPSTGQFNCDGELDYTINFADLVISLFNFGPCE